MGGKQEKRKIRKMNERKFVFDWDTNEDTAKDFNPIYAERHDLQLFGRCACYPLPKLTSSPGAGADPNFTHSIDLALRCSGHIAGIDIKEQLKKRSQFYQQLLQERQTDTEKARSAYVLLGDVACFVACC